MMFPPDFAKRRVEAFKRAGERANPKNDVSDCDSSEAHLDITRLVTLPHTADRHAMSVIVDRLHKIAEDWDLRWDPDREEFTRGDAGEAGEQQLICRVSGKRFSICMSWRRYFGAECRDNTPEDFGAWAEGYSRAFDEAEAALSAPID